MTIALRAPLAASLLTACAAASAQPPMSSDREPPVVSSGREEGGAGSVQLVRHHADVAHYERHQAASLSGGRSGHAFRFESRSTFEVRPRDAHRFAVVSRFDPLEIREEGEPVDPLPGPLRGLERVRLRHVVDARNRVVNGPVATGPGRRRPLVRQLVGLFRHLRLVLPAHPVDVGERWSGPPVRWDTRPFGMVTFTGERAHVLERVDDGRARIRWEGELQIPPFEAMGVRLEGSGTLRGLSVVSLEDGVAGSTNLDLEVALRPAGAAPTLTSLLSFRVKYVERVSRLP